MWNTKLHLSSLSANVSSTRALRSSLWWHCNAERQESASCNHLQGRGHQHSGKEGCWWEAGGWWVVHDSWCQLKWIVKTFGTPFHWQVGKRTLKRKLLYCLSEAARQLTVRKLKAAKVVSLQQDLFFFRPWWRFGAPTVNARMQATHIAAWQDARRHRMAVRFTCCDDVLLHQSSGFIGVFDQAEYGDLTAVGCRDATVSVIQQLFVPAKPPPFVQGESWHILT